MITAFDTNRDCTRFIPFLRGLGMRTAIRYYTGAASPKRIGRPEAEALVAAGFTLGAVFQERQNSGDDFSKAVGVRAGRLAHDYALQVIGQPAGSAIYFSVDFDASAAELRNAVTPYFQGVREGMASASGGIGGYAIGVYGSGLTCRTLKDAGLVEFTWLAMSMGFRESRAYRDSRAWNVLQSLQVDSQTSAGPFAHDPDEIGATGMGDFTIEVAAPEATGSRRRVTARDGLSLRGGPGLEFAKVGLLPFGTVVNVVRVSGDWSQVDLQGDGAADGFVFSGFLAAA